MGIVAIYPGTFDPITKGHEDVIERAAHIFETVIIAVADSASKKPQTALADRVSMCKETFSDKMNIEVESFTGLLIDFARSKEVTVLVRGIRSLSDVEFECQLARMNRQMAPEIETIFIPASEMYASISSSMVREIVSMGGDVSLFVPPEVAKRL